MYFISDDIQKKKGVKTLLDVCRKLPQIPFVFAGKGPLEDEVTALPNVGKPWIFERKRIVSDDCRSELCRISVGML